VAGAGNLADVLALLISSAVLLSGPSIQDGPKPQDPPPISRHPRLRTLLKSGAAIFAEDMANADSVSVQLFASAKGVEETPATHGLRHLLEHLLVKGRDKSLDRRLESKGMFLTADTFRDAMKIEITCAPKDAVSAVRALGELLRPLETSPNEIVQEIKVIEQELALLSADMRLSNAAWTQAFGAEGLDPLGSISVMAGATPEALVELHQRQFAKPNLVISIAGRVDVDQVTAVAREVLGADVASPTEPVANPRTDGRSGTTDSIAPGDARAAIVEGLDDDGTLHALAAGFALANRFRCRVMYTPSLQNGLVVLTDTGGGGFDKRIDELPAEEVDALWPLGQALLKNWLQGGGTPSDVAYRRGMLLVQRLDLRPESLVERVGAMGLLQFRQGFDRFRRDQAVSVVGRG